MRLFATLSLLALLGAGCAATTQTTVESDTSVQTQPAEAEVNVETDGTTTVTTDDGVQVEFETEADVETQPATEQPAEEEVPVTEVTLGSEADVVVDVEIGNFSISPSKITAAPGDKVRLNFTKVSGFHTFVIDALDLNLSAAQGESLEFTAPSAPGQYPYYCDIGSHRDFGLEGTLIVQ